MTKRYGQAFNALDDIDKKYQIIYADPPWSFQGGGGRKPPYPVMKTEEIKKLPIKELADDNCALFLWASDPQLHHALEVIDAWGFKFKTVAFTWVKKNNGTFPTGLGYWTRGNPEMCLLAIMGKCQRVSKNIRQLVISPRRGHSRKPDEIRDKIVMLMGDLPRIELFARQRFDGWDAFGNETGNTVQKIL